MQKSGSRLLHMSPKAILDVSQVASSSLRDFVLQLSPLCFSSSTQAAEKLYQKGFLSYPRTETDQYDKDFDFKPLIEKQIQDNNWGGFAQRFVSVVIFALSTILQLTRNLFLSPDFRTESSNVLETERRTIRLILRSIRRLGQALLPETRRRSTSS